VGRQDIGRRRDLDGPWGGNHRSLRASVTSRSVVASRFSSSP
jgi:hypothetical protein